VNLRIKRSVLVLLPYLWLNLHLLRNISLIGYLLILALVYVPALIYCFSEMRRVKATWIAIWFVLFLVSSLSASLATFLDYGIDAGIYATARYFLAMPMILITYVLLRTETEMRKVLLLFCIVVLLGSLTIPLQYAVGPITWFAESSERAGIVRLASLLGSLTAAGNVIPVAVYVALVLRLSKPAKLVLVTGLVISGLLTLQKAALLGIPLAIGMYLVYLGRQKWLKAIATSSAIVVFALVANGLLSEWPMWQQVTGYAVAVLQLSDSSGQVGDIVVGQSIIDRLTDLPQQALADLYRHRGELGYLLGGGFGMVGAALMRPDDSPFITAHNGYVDLLLVGGILHLVAFWGLMSTALIRLWNLAIRHRRESTSDEVPSALVGIVIIFLIVSLFAGGLTYQPVTASLLWVILGFVWRLEQNLHPASRVTLSRVSRA
jgi:hypothetical protein